MNCCCSQRVEVLFCRRWGLEFSDGGSDGTVDAVAVW